MTGPRSLLPGGHAWYQVTLGEYTREGIPGDREYINGQVYQGVSTPGGYTRGVGKLQASGVGIPGDGYDLMHPHTPGTEI